MRATCFFLLLLAAAGCDALPVQDVPVGAKCPPGNSCVACKAHGDCPSQVCDSYGDVGAAGQCVAAASVIYVFNQGGECNNPQGNGTLANPFCDLAEAVKAGAAGKIVRVLPSGAGYKFPQSKLLSGTTVLIGPAESGAGKAATLIGPDNLDGGDSNNTIVVPGAGSLVLDGFLITPEEISGAQGCKLTLRRSRLSYLMQAANFAGCTVVLDRMTISNLDPGLAFKDSDVKISNSFFVGSALSDKASLLGFAGGTASFYFNTVAFNTRAGSTPLVACSGGKTEFKNSIFVQNGAGAQLAPECKLVPNSLVVGRTDTATSTQIRQDPAFQEPSAQDLRLRPESLVDQQFLIDKAVGVNPAVDKFADHDFFGTPRPQGAGYDIGAFEAGGT